MDLILHTVQGIWQFLLLICATAPVGLWQFVIAAIGPAIFLPWLSKALPENFHPRSREFIAENIALAAAILLAWLPWRTLQGALIGIMAGFMSPYLTKGGQAIGGVLFRWWRRRLGDTP